MANSYLSRSVSSAGNRKTFTLSAWVKRSKISSGEHNIFGNSDSGYNNGFVVKFNSSDQLRIIMQDSSNYEKKPDRLFRDCNGWYHLVIQVDTTQATATDRVKLWVNGVQETSFATDTMPAQNYDTHWNNTTQITTVGRAGNYNGDYYDGYITHAANVDGSVVAPTEFGETDSTSGIWKFKSPSGISWGTNGFHLKMENSGNLGLDSSGQTNNFTTNGNLRQALDTPSNVYCTGNPLSSANSEAFSGNTNIFFDDTGQWRAMYSTLGASSGKWYMEAKIDAVGGEASIGVIPADRAAAHQDTGDYLGKETDSVGYLNNGRTFKNNSEQQTGLTAMSSGTIMGIAMDLDNNTVQFYVNGSASGNAVALTANKTYLFGFSGYSDTRYYANFGNGYFNTTAISSAGSNGNGSLFEYDVPSGFYALNTKNINTYG